MTERIFECPFCPCVFSSAQDLELHLAAFGRLGRLHRAKWDSELKKRKWVRP